MAGETNRSDAAADGRNDVRTANRVPVGFRVDYQGRGARGKGSGLVRNISLTGALIEGADTLLIGGAEVTLRFSFFPDSVPVDIAAKVTRETDDGFGVSFLHMNARVKTVLRMAINKLASEGADETDEDDDDEERTLMRVRRGTR